GRGTGPNLIKPLDLELGSDGISVFVEDLAFDAVFRVDRVSGNRSIVSGAGVGSGPSIDRLQEGLAITPDQARAYVVDIALGVVEIDLATGARTVVSG